MISQKRIEVAGEIVEWLRLAVHDLDVTANMRNRTAISCFAIAQDHHHAIVVLSVNDGVKPCLLRQKARPDPISSFQPSLRQAKGKA